MLEMIVHASGDATGTAAGGTGMAGMLPTLLMLALMVVIFYFLLIRPQKKKEKQTKEMIAALGVGDTITTIGGIVGKITKLRDEELYIATGMVGNPNERSTMRITKWAVRDVVKKAESSKALDEPDEEETESAEEEE